MKRGVAVGCAFNRMACLLAMAFAVLVVSLFLTAALPQQAYAYDTWVKIYDSDMNLIWSSNGSGGVNSVDASVFEEGIYVEKYIHREQSEEPLQWFNSYLDEEGNWVHTTDFRVIGEEEGGYSWNGDYYVDSFGTKIPSTYHMKTFMRFRDLDGVTALSVRHYAKGNNTRPPVVTGDCVWSVSLTRSDGSDDEQAGSPDDDNADGGSDAGGSGQAGGTAAGDPSGSDAPDEEGKGSESGEGDTSGSGASDGSGSGSAREQGSGQSGANQGGASKVTASKKGSGKTGKTGATGQENGSGTAGATTDPSSSSDVSGSSAHGQDQSKEPSSKADAAKSSSEKKTARSEERSALAYLVGGDVPADEQDAPASSQVTLADSWRLTPSLAVLVLLAAAAPAGLAARTCASGRRRGRPSRLAA